MVELGGNAERGRREVLMLAGFCAVAFALLGLQAWRVSGHFPGWVHPGALLGVIALGLLTYGRRRWARILLVVFLGLACVALALGAWQGFYYSPAMAVVLLIVAVLLAGAAWRLQTSPHIDAFLI
jgi:hypothetical protein